jgi:hypothetical protein
VPLAFFQLVQQFRQVQINHWFTAGYNYKLVRVVLDLVNNPVAAYVCAGVLVPSVFSIAPFTSQRTTRQSYENTGYSGEPALSLQRIEYFANSHLFRVFFLMVLI